MTHFLVTIPADVEPAVNDHEQLSAYEWMTADQAREAFQTLDPQIAARALRMLDAAVASGERTPVVASSRPYVQ